MVSAVSSQSSVTTPDFLVDSISNRPCWRPGAVAVERRFAFLHNQAPLSNSDRARKRRQSSFQRVMGSGGNPPCCWNSAAPGWSA